MADECVINYNEAPSTLNEQLFMEDLSQRKLFLDSNINENTFRSVGYYILRINEEDKHIPSEKRKPIKLYIACDGGEVFSGINLMNIMLASQTPIYTVVVGQAFSMAFYISICGTKRYAFKNSAYLIHDGGVQIQSSTYKVRDYVNFDEQINKEFLDLIAQKTNISKEELEEKSRIEWYLLADEAKEKGIVDFIIGEDCMLEEVV